MAEVSRRNFVWGASIGVVAAAAAPTLAGLGGVGGSTAVAAPAAPPADSGAGAAIPSGGPVVAQLLDAESGKVVVYHGTREVIVHDPALVRALAAALA